MKPWRVVLVIAVLLFPLCFVQSIRLLDELQPPPERYRIDAIESTLSKSQQSTLSLRLQKMQIGNQVSYPFVCVISAEKAASGIE